MGKNTEKPENQNAICGARINGKLNKTGIS